jgi:hypothetical protein
MRKLLARVVLRSALAISAVGLVAAAGAFSGSPSSGPGAVPDRPAVLIAPLASAVPAEPAGQAARSEGAQAAQPTSYTLHTENGPRAALAARIVTATLLLTGLVLTGLGAIGMRGPSLHRRPEAVEPAPPPGYAPAYPPHPGSHPRFGPPPT